jgi:hypothetical protein
MSIELHEVNDIAADEQSGFRDEIITPVKRSSKDHQDAIRRARMDPSSEEYVWVDPAVDVQKQKFPWKPVLLALFLLIIGTILTTVGAVFYAKGYEGCLSILIIGCLTFIPGAYHVWIAFQSFRGVDGYGYHQIPNPRLHVI